MNFKKKVEKIHIEFENCTYVELDNTMFRSLILNDITTSKIINCYQYTDGEFEDRMFCSDFSIIINKEGLKQKISLSYEMYDDEILEEKLKKIGDITAIRLYYTDGSQEEINLEWNEEVSLYCNMYQKTTFIEETQEALVKVFKVRSA